jgi:hypothetical protein
MKKEQKKAFLDELSKIQDKPISKVLNKLFFQPSKDEVSGFVDELNPAKAAPNPIGGADQGNGQSQDLVGSSRSVSPGSGPGGA